MKMNVNELYITYTPVFTATHTLHFYTYGYAQSFV